MTITPEQLRASAAETRVKVLIVQDDPMIYPPLLDEMRRSAATVDQAAAEIDRLNAALVEERTTILELQRETCARDGVPMPSERPLVDKLRAEIERLHEALLKDADTRSSATLPEKPT